MEILNQNGFLGTRASLMMDIVFCAMFVVVPVLLFSIYLVKYKRKYSAHKFIQLALGIVLGIAVTLFEIHIRFHGWLERAQAGVVDFNHAVVWTVLIIHLSICIPTTFIWIYTIFAALRHIPVPPGPSPYSHRHRFWGKLSAVGMILTAITGWTFYYLAFVQ